MYYTFKQHSLHICFFFVNSVFPIRIPTFTKYIKQKITINNSNILQRDNRVEFFYVSIFRQYQESRRIWAIGLNF